MSKRKRRKVTARDVYRHVDTLPDTFIVYGRGKFQRKLDEFFEKREKNLLKRYRGGGCCADGDYCRDCDDR